MKYAEVRKIARTGDKITISSGGLISNIIRMVMGDSESHVAVLMFDNSGTELMLIHQVEMQGFRIDYASTYIKRMLRMGKGVTFNRAPEIVCSDEEKAKAWLKDARRADEPYGYTTLLVVGMIRFFGGTRTYKWISDHKWINPQRFSAVCSVFAQRFDQHMGYDKFSSPLVGPGEFRRYRDGLGSYVIEADDKETT